MGSLTLIYDKLNDYDWVTYDFQYKSDLKYIFDQPLEQLVKVFPGEELKSNIFCAGWFASKKGVFLDVQLEQLLEGLKSGEADVMALFGRINPFLIIWFFVVKFPIIILLIIMLNTQREIIGLLNLRTLITFFMITAKG